VQAARLRPKEEGLQAICEKLGLSCIAPRRKINVMIVGNHSAGKSSYINWYIGEHVQSTAVAIETQGFTLVTSGKRRETLKGQATMQLFKHLKEELEPFAPQIYNGLQTEVSTSKERCFPLITFIDTPGLVDGSFQYPFPVEDAILQVAKHVDLIYIFFDPIGQALCDRTMNVIERLNQEHAEKLKYFLSKADTVPNERDRQKVVVQITQNLSSRVRNAHAFELPSLYIPGSSNPSCKIDNIIEQTCDEMQQTINQSVQNNLDKLEQDCRVVSERIEELLKADAVAQSHNLKAATYGWLAFFASLLGPLVVLMYALHQGGLITSFAESLAASDAFSSKFPSKFPSKVLTAFGQTCDVLVTGGDATGGDATAARTGGLLSRTQFVLGSFGYFVVLQVASRLLRRYQPAFTKREIANLSGTQRYVTQDLLELKTQLWKRYLEQCSSDPSGMQIPFSPAGAPGAESPANASPPSKED
jgi:GTPase Era involved in 16S rRNA processing